MLTEDEIVIEGDTSILQTGHGIEPFGVMMGAIAVRNEMDMNFRLLFTRTKTNGGF